MIDKKIIFVGIILLLAIFFISFISAAEMNYCCEKTIDGAWCINTKLERCDNSIDPVTKSKFRSVPTSCEATSYCKLGTCYDSQEGTCMENTPQRVCQDSGGVWDEKKSEDVGQCQLGCCLIGDQAAFVTQTRCKRLSSVYGLEINFRTDISSEISCIASATSDVEGACVFDKEFERTCKFTTKRECQTIGGTNGTSVEFHEGYLCSAESLGTNCGPSKKTTCVEDKDEVYFLDSCGNKANIYDSSKIDSKEYWSKIYNKDESCNPSSNNADSATCGNCDYYSGSVCKKFNRGEDKKSPSQGEHICRDLGCEWKGKEYKHGETWCADSLGTSKINVDKKASDNSKENLPGSRYFRAVCYNGDVTVEPCADFRQEVCIQSDINGFKTAACRVNMWQDCYSQGDKKDCENADKRDCQWIDGISINSASASSAEKSKKNEGACVPLFAPGFNFWEATSESDSLCSQANTQCVVTFTKKMGGEETCKDNCECLKPNWEEQMNKACISIGDCGSKTNYIGVQGYNTGNSVKTEDKKESSTVGSTNTGK